MEVHLVAHKVMIVCGKACKGQRILRVALWYFSVWVVSVTKGRRLFLNNKIDLVAGQESWEKEDTTLHVERLEIKLLTDSL